MFQEGESVGPYVLTRRLGIGAFGQVWLAKHADLGAEFALKIPTHEEHVRQLRREGQNLFRLRDIRHRNIVELHDVNTASTPPYLAMEYVDGQDLRRYLESRGRLPVPQALEIVRQVAEALSAAHAQGMLHRDIKPANILLTRDGVAKVADFGLGKIQADFARAHRGSYASADPDHVSDSFATDRSKSVEGTLAYMSPEVSKGEDPEPSDDLYAVGLVGCELMTGAKPAAAGVARQMDRAGVPKEVIAVFEKACDEREYRYQEASEMLAAVTEVDEVLRERAEGERRREEEEARRKQDQERRAEAERREEEARRAAAEARRAKEQEAQRQRKAQEAKRRAEEERMARRARETGSRSDWQAYLRLFPQGAHAAEAQRTLARPASAYEHEYVDIEASSSRRPRRRRVNALVPLGKYLGALAALTVVAGIVFILLDFWSGPPIVSIGLLSLASAAVLLLAGRRGGDCIKGLVSAGVCCCIAAVVAIAVGVFAMVCGDWAGPTVVSIGLFGLVFAVAVALAGCLLLRTSVAWAVLGVAFCLVLPQMVWPTRVKVRWYALMLRSGDASTRRKTVQMLAGSAPTLCNTLRDRDAEVRQAAAMSLAEIGAAAAPAVPALCERLRDPDAGVRVTAALALGRVGAEAAPAAPSLVASLRRDGVVAVRRAAAEALGRIGPKAAFAVPALTSALADRESAIRRDAAIALGALGSDAAPAVPALRLAVSSNVSDVRSAALQALARIAAGVPSAMSALTDAVKHGRDSETRRAAMRHLGDLGAKAQNAIPTLVEAMRDRHTRKDALEALRRMGRPAVAHLCSALSAEHRDIFLGAASVLGDLGPDAAEAVPDLVRALQAPRSDLPRAAALALCKIGSPTAAAVTALASVLSSTTHASSTKEAVAQSLAAMGQKATAAIQALTDCLSSKSAKLRAISARALAKIAPESREVASALARVLDDGSSDVRMAGAQALGEMGPSAAPGIAHIVPLLISDPEQGVRQASGTALVQIGAPSVTALVGVLSYADPAHRALAARLLGNIGPAAHPATEALIQSLGDVDSKTRGEAARALGRIGPEARSAAPALKKLLNEVDPAVRAAAREALRRLEE